MLLGRGIARDVVLAGYTDTIDEASIQIMYATDVKMRESAKIFHQGLLSFVQKVSDGRLTWFQGRHTSRSSSLALDRRRTTGVKARGGAWFAYDEQGRGSSVPKRWQLRVSQK